MSPRIMMLLIGAAFAVGQAPLTRADSTDDEGNPLPLLATARLGIARTNQPIGALAFSRDGTRLASGSAGDGVACVWDLDTRKLLHRFTGLSRAAVCVALAADGQTLATADGVPVPPSDEGVRHICLWNLADGTLIRKFPAHVQGVASLDFAPDGKTLVSAGFDGWVRLRDVATGARRAQVRGSDRGWNRARFAPDGKTVMIACRDGQLSLWRSDLKTRLHAFLPCGKQTESIDGAAFVDGGTRVLAQETYRFGLSRFTRRWAWDVATGYADEPLAVPDAEAAAPAARAFSPDGRLFVSSLSRFQNEGIAVRTVDTDFEMVRLPAGDGRGCTLAFSPDGKTLASGMPDATILLWEVTRLRQAYALHQFLGEPGRADERAIELAANAMKATAFVRARLTCFASAEKTGVHALVVALDSDVFEERDRASHELAAIAAEVAPALRAALARDRISLETRRRVRLALDGIRPDGGDRGPCDCRRAQIGLAILEQYDTKEARAALAAVAEFAPRSAIGRSAQSVLDRLHKAAATQPR